MRFASKPPGHRHSNSLRRRTDRMQSWARVVAAVVLSVAAPASGILVSDAFAADLRQDAPVHRTTAVAQEDATRSAAFVTESGSPRAMAEVTWQMPDGSSHTAEAAVPVNTRDNARVTVWLDERGKPQSPPPPAQEVQTMSLSAGILAGSGAAAVVLGGYQLARMRIAALCAREWEHEWEQVEPLWSQRK